ncbi:MAG TPA: glycosyltransferase family 1 protein [Patescibacteria group bacterium]|nr:glycosyltransferase family 1 protein [Patescibacteria group bacterium]
MRILFDTHQLNALNVFRGSGVYADNLLSALRGVPEVEILHPGDRGDADLVHYPFFDIFFHTLPLIKKLPTVVTIHDVIPLAFPAQYPAGIKGMARFLLQLSSLQSVKAVITDSECSKRDIAKYLGYPIEHIYVAYLAANPLLERPSPGELKEIVEKYKLPKHYILYVGDINYNKNLPRFIHAASKLPKDVQVVMVGKALMNTDIPEGKALHTAISKSGIGERVHLITNVPREPTVDMSAIMSMAACYVQPSLYEGFGLPVLDAMKLGVPVASSNTSSLPEVGGTAAAYFTPNNEEEITSVIHNVLSMPNSERQAVVRRGLAQSRSFSWAKTAEQTAVVYKKVLERS